MTDPNRLDPDHLEEHLEALQAWLDTRWNEEPLSTDETVQVLRELVNALRLVPEIPLQTLYTAARQVRLAKEAEVLRTLANMATNIAGLQEG